MNGNCVKFEKEILRQKPRGDEYKMQGVPLQYPLDTMSVNSEIAWTLQADGGNFGE